MSTALCPSCRSPLPASGTSCPACGLQAAPAIPDLGLGLGFGDEPIGRGAEPAAPAGPSAYGGTDAAGFGDDDPFGAPIEGGSLELDLPARPPAPEPPPPPSAPAEPAAPTPPPASEPSAPAPVAEVAPASARTAPAEPPEPAAIIARYPPAPEKPWQTPLYALKVLWRQLELWQDLDALRKRRSPDVPLYERALKVYDRRAFTIGLAIDLAVLAIATILFFMPVILRFANAP